MSKNKKSLNFQPEIIEDITGGWVKEWDSSGERCWWVPREYIKQKKKRPDFRIEDNWEDRPSRPKLNKLMLEEIKNQEKEIKSEFESIGYTTFYLMDRQKDRGSYSPSPRRISHCRKIIEKLKEENLDEIFPIGCSNLKDEILELDFGLSDEKTKQAVLRTLLYLAQIDAPESFIEKDLEYYWEFEIRCPRCGDSFQVRFDQYYNSSQETFKKSWPHNHPETHYYCPECVQERLNIIKEKKKLEHPKWIDKEHPNYLEVKSIYQELFRQKLGITPSSSAREQELYESVCSVLDEVDNSRIVRNNRYILDGLELDIYIPDRRLAFEYQGKQHEEAVNFGGDEDSEERLQKQKERDKETRKRCEKKDITLIEVWSDEKITENRIRKKIENAN